MRRVSCMIVIVALVASVVMSTNAPPLPQIAGTFTLQSVKSNPFEGVTSACDTYFQTDHSGRVLQNCSNPHGFYATLLRNDLQHIYLFYRENGGTKCYAYPATQPLAPPSFNLPYFGQMTALNGRLANAYKLTFRDYTTTILLDAETLLPLAKLNGEMMDWYTTTINTFLNGSVPSDAVFDVPAECNTAEALQPPLSESARFAINRHVKESGVSILFGEPLIPSDTLLSYAVPKHHRTPLAGAVNRLSVATKVALPASVDNSRFATPVRNQAFCGACWTFASAALTEVVMRKKANATVTYNSSSWLSVQSLIDCAHQHNDSTALIPSKGCLGGWPSTALNQIVNNGIAWDTAYPFQAVNGDCKLNSSNPIFPLASAHTIAIGNVTGMMEAVHKNGAVVAIISFFLTIPIGDALYAGGVYDNSACTPGLAHAVTIVGYGTTAEGLDYWLIKNSLSQAWGDNGYFKMARGVNMCGIEDYTFTAVAA